MTKKSLKVLIIGLLITIFFVALFVFSMLAVSLRYLGNIVDKENYVYFPMFTSLAALISGALTSYLYLKSKGQTEIQAAQKVAVSAIRITILRYLIGIIIVAGLLIWVRKELGGIPNLNDLNKVNPEYLKQIQTQTQNIPEQTDINASPEVIPSAVVPIEDISNWKTYRNEEYGVEFKYAENYINSDFASGKMPELIVLNSSSHKIIDNCFYYPYPDYPKWGIEKRGIIKLNNIEFCLSVATDAGMGSVFPTYYYTTKGGDNYFVIKFETRMVGTCDNYSDLTEQNECKEFRKNIDGIIKKPIENIISTFQFLLAR